MTDEEISELIKDISEQISQLSADPDRKFTKKERKHLGALLARKQALAIIKAAKESGNQRQETKATVDYALLTEYGEKNILLYNIMKSKSRGPLFW